MARFRLALALLIAASALAGVVALQAPVLADGHDICPQRPLPPALEGVCRACPTVVDPVVCTVACSGGPRQETFSNQCFASCSGFVILDECQRVGT